MSRGRMLAMWGGLVVVVAVSLVVAATRGPAPTADDRVDGLARELRCPTCQSESIAESRSATAQAIRADLVRRVEAGESDDEIRAHYVDRYTEWILLAPADDGIGFVVWGLPVLVVVLGASAIVVVVRRGSIRRRATAADDALVEEMRSGAH